MDKVTDLPMLRRPLPWPLAVAALGVLAFPLGWLCAWAGVDREAMVGNVFVLLVLMASIPFMLRRTHAFTLAGLALAVGVGLVPLALGAWLGRDPTMVVWLAMTAALILPAQPTAYGRIVDAQTELERRSVVPSSSTDTPAEQVQRMLWVFDFLIVLALAALGLWLKGVLA